MTSKKAQPTADWSHTHPGAGVATLLAGLCAGWLAGSPHTGPAAEAQANALSAPGTPGESGDFGALLGRREAWPRSVRLKSATQFPAVMGGKVVGAIEVPAGTEVRVRALRAGGVEAEYRGGTAIIAAEKTDLLERSFPATAPAPEADPPAAGQTTSLPAATPSVKAAPVTPPSAAGSTGLSSAEMLRRLSIDVLRSRRRRVEGGDFDDKIDRLSVRVKCTNQDTRHAFAGWRAKVFVLTESVLVSGVFKVAIAEEFPVDIAPRATFERETKEVESGFDTTYAKWGYKYSGWILALDDPGGKRVLVKATNPTWEKAALAGQLDGLQVEKTYDRELKPQVSPEERFSR